MLHASGGILVKNLGQLSEPPFKNASRSSEVQSGLSLLNKLLKMQAAILKYGQKCERGRLRAASCPNTCSMVGCGEEKREVHSPACCAAAKKCAKGLEEWQIEGTRPS